MKLGKRLLFSGLLIAAALLVVGTYAPQAAQAQEQKKKGGGKGSASFKGEKFGVLFRDSVANASKSTVRVKCDGKDTALGVVISPDGFILTKASDLHGKITVKVATGEEIEAKWVGHHDPHDLAVLKIDASNLTPIEFSDSKVAPVGNFVASAGTGTDPVAVGVVSVAARNVPPPKIVKKGEGEGKGKGPAEPKGGVLGVITVDDPRGAKVTEAPEVPKGGGGGGKGGKAGPASPAAGKVKVDDIIVAIGPKAIKNAETYTKELEKFKAGDELVLRIIRGDEFVELKLKLNKAAPSRADQQNNMGSELSKRRTGFNVILQHDSVVKPFDCGGPLVDLEGHVIGINIARWGRVESYAIPSEAIRPLLQDLMSGKMPPQKKSEDKKK